MFAFSRRPIRFYSTSLSPKYSIARNSRGSLPVYTDIRNGGTRYEVHIKNVQGDINALRDDLVLGLQATTQTEPATIRTQIVPHRNTIILSGRRWKHYVMNWLIQKGF